MLEFRLARETHPWDLPDVSKIKVGIAGGTGYSGLELLELLKKDSQFEVLSYFGREAFDATRLKNLDLVFLCTPNEVSLEMAPKILEQGVSVIDLSGAFRLKTHSYSQWYGFEHTESHWLSKAEYSLFPWVKLASFKELPGPRLIANPGCYATAVLMTLIPLLKSSLIDPNHVFLDAKSGTSGAGRKPHVSLLFSEVFGEFRPYKVGQHQHWPEIVEYLEVLSGVTLNPSFVTELLPIERGISLACFAEWAPQLPMKLRNAEKLKEVFDKAYESDVSVRIGTDEAFASLKSIQKSNRVSIQVGVAFDKPMIFTVIDNLQRGAAGQALMNAYQLLGQPLPEFLL